METKISTTIVDEWWLDDDTYIVYCDTYQIMATDGTMSDCHLEVEWWNEERTYHFICVGDGCETWNPTMNELSQEERNELIRHIETKISA